jgi:hypothetical protein
MLSLGANSVSSREHHGLNVPTLNHLIYESAAIAVRGVACRDRVPKIAFLDPFQKSV